MLRVIAVVCVVVAISIPALADEGLVIDSVDITNAPQMSLIISVPAEVVAMDPAASDFAVLVEGVRVSADVFALVRDPMEVVIVIDTSGSMAGEPMQAAASAALGFVDSLPEIAQVALVTFGDEAVARNAMGATRSEVAESLSTLVAEGETALYDAMVTAALQFTEADARRVLVVLSDGADTVSAADLDQAIAAAAAANAEVRAVALQTSESAHDALSALTSNGSITTAVNAADLAAAYQTVALELTGRYRLTFQAASTGSVQIDVFVNGPTRVLASSQVVDLTSGVVSPGVSPRPIPAGFGKNPTPAVPVIIAEPTGLSSDWALPAGIALVFVGALTMLWLTSKDDDNSLAFAAPVEVDHSIERAGFIPAVGRRVKAIGDRIAGRNETGAMDRALDRAGVALRPGEFVIVSATGVVVGVTAGLVMGGTIGAVFLGAAAAAAPRTILRTLANRRRRAFANQLEGSLQTIAGSLRAGYGLVQAMSTVAEESPSPTSDEFNRVVVESRLGRSIEDSLAAMAERLENEDLGWVVEAIEIQHEVGGNLAEVLDTVTNTIRERNQLRRQVQALSAEGKISAIILISLPLVIAFFIAMISPDYLAELTDTGVGRIMIGVAALLMLAGSAWIKKIIRVDF
ncbi:MAG: type II secretion system F family protein [Acidimicrobiia bacterium]